MDIRICNVTWDRPSRDSLGSMPLGNGDLGANVWATDDGRPRLFLSKTDAWDELHRLVKLGTVTLDADAPLADWAAAGFDQTLHLESGCITLRYGPPDAPAAQLRLWADAHRPVLRIEVTSAEAHRWRLLLGAWRTERRTLDPGESGGSMRQDGVHEHAVEEPDALLPPPLCGPDRIGLYHRNAASILPGLLAHQGLGALVGQVDDPLVDRTFGCLAGADAGAVETGGALAEQVLQCTEPVRRVTFTIAVHTARTPTVEAWAEMLRNLADAADAADPDEAFAAHTAWWEAFWARSFVHVTGDAAAEAITQAYALQRYVTACAGRGAFPIKFNGSIFTAEGPEEMRPEWDGPRVFNPDYRRWGGGYWFQNTRLIYWPLLASGDWDFLEPWFDLFAMARPVAQARCRDQFGLPGIFFPETMTMWGTYRNDNYGYDRPDDLPPGLTVNRYIRRYWQGGLELATILLETLAHTGDTAWWAASARPLVLDILRFYHAYYTDRDADGRVRFAPAQSLETWHDATNPTPELAGLAHVLDRLLALPDGQLSADERAFCRDYRAALPPVPVGREAADEPLRILPAETFDDLKNMENPELYAVFPYPLGALGGPLHAEGEAAYDARRQRTVGGWFQDAIHAALVGRGEEAADLLTAQLAPEAATPAQRAHSKFPRCEAIRFPGFHGPNCDWVPDQDHGGTGMLALQKMLLQHQHGELRILPAWPARWDVHFRLHAPGAVVEVATEGGRVVQQTVTPATQPATA